MTDEQEDAEAEQEAEGVVFIYWVPQEADAERGNTRERISKSTALDVRAGRGTDDFDQGELRVRTTEGVASFDRNHVRGWRTEGPVEVARVDDGEDSAVTGAE